MQPPISLANMRARSAASLDSGIRRAILMNLSVTTNSSSQPFGKGGPVMKSMPIDFHGAKGSSRGVYNSCCRGRLVLHLNNPGRIGCI